MENSIEVQGLCKHYRDFSLQDVSFRVPKGSIVGFIGENGAGKTTTIKAILGLIDTDGGDIRVLGRPVSRAEHAANDGGLVFRPPLHHGRRRPRDARAAPRLGRRAV